MMKKKHFAAALLSTLVPLHAAFAWGDDGHRVVALIALNHMEEGAKAKLVQLLQSDPLSFEMHAQAGSTSESLDRQATWADYYRDSDRGKPNGPRYTRTNHWHYVDIELKSGSLDNACFNYPRLPPGVPASDGAADDCVVDKLMQFAAELADPATATGERQFAVKFIMHFVGDLHQPLHASDDQDRGGNEKKVKSAGLAQGNLHHYWDTEFVHALGPTPEDIAKKLDDQISKTQILQWSSSDPRTWATESFALAKREGYGRLPAPDVKGVYVLDENYVNDARSVVANQLSKAGIRLASTLNALLR